MTRDRQLDKAPNGSGVLAQWWHGPCGGREVTGVAMPLVISTVSYMAMHFCDRMFLGWYSPAAMGAVMPAGVLAWTLFALPMGVAVYTTTFVAQYLGAGRPQRIGLVVWQAVRLGLYSVPLFIAMGMAGPAIFPLFGHSRELADLESLYLMVVSLGSGAVVIGAALESYFVGRGRTMIVMVVNLMVAAVNIGLNPPLIFGFGAIPALGIEGAAWATTIALWLKVASYAWLIGSSRLWRVHGFDTGRRFDAALTRRLLRFGTPNGLQFLVEGSAFTVFALVVAGVSPQAAAANTVAISINLLAFIPVIGVGMAVTALVGREIGAERPRLAARATWTAAAMGVAYTACFAAIYLAFPGPLVAVFGSGGSESEAVAATAVVLLRFVAAYCLFDTLQIVFVSALKGAGDMRFVMGVTIVCGGSFASVGVIGARMFADEQHQLLWWWWMITAWVVSLAAAYLARFLYGAWRKMRVIEPAVIEQGPGGQTACAVQV